MSVPADQLDPRAAFNLRLRRRLEQQATPQAPAPAPVAADPYADNWAAQTARSQLVNIASAAPALASLGAGLVGADDTRQQMAQTAADMAERAQQLGPAVQSFDQVNDVGSAASALGYNVAGLLPDIALTLTGVGAGGVIARRAGTGLVRRAVLDRVEQNAIQRGAYARARAEAGDAAAKAAQAAGATQPQIRAAAISAYDAAPTAVRLQVQQRADDATRRLLSQRTSRASAFTERMERLGRQVGGTVGAFPSLNRENIDVLNREELSQEDAAKLATGTAVASALNMLPVERWLRRFAPNADEVVAGAAKRAAPGLGARTAQQAGVQALAEGSTEALQQATTLATHKWAGENIDLLGDDAINQYLWAGVAGAAIGGPMGAGGELARSGVQALRQRVRDRLAKAARSAPPPAQAPTATGEPPAPASTDAMVRSRLDQLGQAPSDVELDLSADDITKLADRAFAAYQSGDDALLGEANLPPAWSSQLPSRLQQVAASWLRPDSPLRAAETNLDSLRPMFAAAEKVLLKQGVSDTERAQFDALVRAEPRFALWEELDPAYVSALTKLSQTAPVEPTDAEPEAPETAMAQAMLATRTRQTLDAGDVEGRAEQQVEATDDDAPGDDTFGLNVDAIEADPREALYTTQPGTPEYETARQAVYTQVMGRGPDEKNARRFERTNDAAFENRLASPGYVRLTTPSENGREQLLDLGSLASWARAQSGDGSDLKAALLTGLADAIAAGVPIDVSTMTPGRIDFRSGESVRLTPNDVKDIRGYMQQHQLSLPLSVDASADRGAAAKRIPPTGEAAQRGGLVEPRDNDDQIEYGDVDPRLLPREAPPSLTLPGGRSTTADFGIREVNVDDPIGESVLDNAARARIHALAEQMGVAPTQIVKIESKRKKAKLTSLVDARVTMADGSVLEVPVPFAVVGYNRLVDRGGNSEAPAPIPAAERLTPEQIAAQKAKVTEKLTPKLVADRNEYKRLRAKLAAARSQAQVEAIEAEIAKITEKGRQSAERVAKAEATVDAAVKRQEADIERTDRALAKNKPPKPAETPFEQGVKIGEAVLKNEYDNGAISERRYNKLLKALRNPESGAAQRYYERAQRGDYAKVRVRDQAWDGADVDTEQAAQERKDQREGYSTRPYGLQDVAKSLGVTPSQIQSIHVVGKPEETPGGNVEATVALTDGTQRAASVDPRVVGYIKERDTTAPNDASGEPTRRGVLGAPGPDRSSEQATSDAVDAAITKTFGKPRLQKNPKNRANAARTATLAAADKDLRQTYDALGRPLGLRNLASAPRGAKDDIEYDQAADEVTNAPDDGSFPLRQARRFIDALLDAMGISEKVSLRTNDKLPRSGSYQRSKLLVTVGNALRGPERMSVLLHEVGHHVIWNEIAKHVQGGWDTIKTQNLTLAQGLEALAQGDPTLYAALRADFEAHLAKKANSRTPSRTQHAGPRVLEDNPASFNEWMADHIARALETQKTPTDLMGKFFHGIAQALKQVWAAVQGKDYQPAPSVDAWIKSLFDAKVAAVKQATGVSVTAPQAAAAVQAAQVAVAAATPGGPLRENFTRANLRALVDYVSTILPTAERLLLERVFNRAVAVDKLKEHYANDPAVLGLLDDADHGLAVRIAAGFLAWQAGAFKTGPNGRQAFEGMADQLGRLLGASFEGQLAERVMEDIASGLIRQRRAQHREYSARKEAARANGRLQKVLNWVAESGPIRQSMDAFLGGVRSRLHDAGAPALRALSAQLIRPFGANADGDLGLIPAVRDITHRYARRMHQAVEGLDEKQTAEVLSILQRAAAPPAGDKPIADAVTAMRAVMNDAFVYINQARAAAGYPALPKTSNFWPVLLSIKDNDAAERLAAIYNQPQFEKEIRRIAGALNLAARAKQPAATANAAPSNLPPPDPAALTYFEKRRAQWQGKIADVNQSIIDAIVSGSVPQIERQIAASEKREAKRGNNISATLAEAFELERRYMRARIAQLQGAAPSTSTPTASTNNAPVPDDTTPLPELAKLLADLALTSKDGATSFGAPSSTPTFHSELRRLSSFVYSQGTEADKAAFAELQSQDFDEVLTRYIAPMVRRHEHMKRFGGGDNGRAQLDALLDAAKKQGATPEDLALAENAVMAALGSYGTDKSPTLAALSPGLAEKFSGERTRSAVQLGQAYQNLRLLPLAVLSSLVDPLGIAVRSGGDLAVAWAGIKNGFKAWGGKAAWQDGLQLLEDVGAADDFLPAIAGRAVFDGPEHSWAKTINDSVFKYNGMSALVQTTRVMALHAGHAMLLKHAAGKGDSARYLQELGLEPSDVQPDPQNPGRVVLNSKTRQALRWFIDEAILRPNAMQTPLWHADPFMGLVTQYKGFAYAIYDQILKRVDRELTHGNSWVLLGAAMYLPVMLVAELLREWLQHGPDGNPNRKDWGLVDYTTHAAVRTSLVTPQMGFALDIKSDIEHQRLPGTSQLGPTGGQAVNAYSAFLGRRALDKEFEASLPLSTLWKNWNDNFGVEEKAA